VLQGWTLRSRRFLFGLSVSEAMIASLHDLTCAGPDDCTCKAVYIAKPTPRVKERKRLQGKPHVIPESVRETVFASQDYVCAWCGVIGGRLVFHHRLLRSHGGRDIPGHGVGVHSICHMAIHRVVAEAKRRRFIVSSEAELAQGWVAA